MSHYFFGLGSPHYYKVPSIPFSPENIEVLILVGLKLVPTLDLLLHLGEPGLGVLLQLLALLLTLLFLLNLR